MQPSDGYDTKSSDPRYDVEGHAFNSSCRMERRDEEQENYNLMLATKVATESLEQTTSRTLYK